MTEILTRYEALCLCLARAKTQEQMAADLRVSQPTISNWVCRSKQMPAEHVLTAERLYGVSRHDLRPDIYPREAQVDGGAQKRIFGIDQFQGRAAHSTSGSGALAK